MSADRPDRIGYDGSIRLVGHPVHENRLMETVEIGQHLVIDPRVCHGQLTFKGTRLPVDTILFYLANGRTMEEIVTDWPELTPAALAEAVNLAAAALVEKSMALKQACRESTRTGRSA